VTGRQGVQPEMNKHTKPVMNKPLGIPRRFSSFI